MTWLARLEVDAEALQTNRISDDIYAWHKMLWECYPDIPDAKRDFLTRIDQLEGRFLFWILTERKPLRPQWCPADGFALKEVSPSFLDHRYYVFDVRANPVKTIELRDSNGNTLLRPDGKRKNGKRVPLCKPDELRAWLDRKAQAGGFRILEDKPLEISRMIECYFRKKDKKTSKSHSAYHGGVQFRGTLEVFDHSKFKETYRKGIGKARAFGFGLLLLAPIDL